MLPQYRSPFFSCHSSTERQSCSVRHILWLILIWVFGKTFFFLPLCADQVRSGERSWVTTKHAPCYEWAFFETENILIQWISGPVNQMLSTLTHRAQCVSVSYLLGWERRSSSPLPDSWGDKIRKMHLRTREMQQHNITKSTYKSAVRANITSVNFSSFLYKEIIFYTPNCRIGYFWIPKSIQSTILHKSIILALLY